MVEKGIEWVFISEYFKVRCRETSFEKKNYDYTDKEYRDIHQIYCRACANELLAQVMY